jgi:hypothetical protein
MSSEIGIGCHFDDEGREIFCFEKISPFVPQVRNDIQHWSHYSLLCTKNLKILIFCPFNHFILQIGIHIVKIVTVTSHSNQ